MAYPAWCVVRASMALPPGRSRFWATCGVTFNFLHSATKSAVSYVLSPPTVTLPQVLDIFDNLDLMRRTMVLTDAATALRVSEILALMWKDLDFRGAVDTGAGAGN